METVSQPDAQKPPAAILRRRWYYLTPDRLVIGLLGVEVLLWLSERFQWFPFSTQRASTVLIAVACVTGFLVLMLLWFAVSFFTRLRFQFGIRTLLVLAVAVAIVSSWFAGKIQEAKRQRDATDLITKLGGHVTYDYEFDLPVIPPRNSPPRGPAWLRQLLGGDFLDRVTEVYPGGDADAAMEIAQGLPNLWSFCTNWRDPDPYTSSKLSDAGLARLGTMHRLNEAGVWGPNITDDGLVHLESLHQLTVLDVGGPKITDAGLKHLENLHTLEILGLQSERITDDGLVHLQSLHNLKRLTLRCSISDEGMKHLIRLTNLTTLTCHGFPSNPKKDKAIDQLRFPTHLEFVDTPLIDVCEYMQDFHHIKFEIDDPALKEAKISRLCEITLNAKGVTLRAALNSLLDPADLAWHVGQDGIVITTKAAYAKRHPNLLRLQQTLPNLKKVEVDW